MVSLATKEQLKYASMECGEQFVTTCGREKMLKLSAGSWDSRQKVSVSA